MKTISTTRFARATDPFSNSGAIGLLSIFTKFERGDKEEGGMVERELKRGLGQSPKKGKKGKKFLRYVLIFWLSLRVPSSCLHGECDYD